MSQNGMLVNFASEDSEGQARVKAFAEALQKLGVAEGSNVLTENALPRTMPILIIVTRRSWWHWHQTSSLPLPARAGPCADVAGAFCCSLHGECYETCRPKEEPSLQAKENPARARGA